MCSISAGRPVRQSAVSRPPPPPPPPPPAGRCRSPVTRPLSKVNGIRNASRAPPLSSRAVPAAAPRAIPARRRRISGTPRNNTKAPCDQPAALSRVWCDRWMAGVKKLQVSYVLQPSRLDGRAQTSASSRSSGRRFNCTSMLTGCQRWCSEALARSTFGPVEYLYTLFRPNIDNQHAFQ